LQPDDLGGFFHVRNVFWVAAALAELTSTATRMALGTRSCRSRSRLAATSSDRKLMPVALPPGRAILVTAFLPAEVLKPLPERREAGLRLRVVLAVTNEHSDPTQWGRLTRAGH
jgi:hypothetical protein